VEGKNSPEEQKKAGGRDRGAMGMGVRGALVSTWRMRSSGAKVDRWRGKGVLGGGCGKKVGGGLELLGANYF